MSDGGEYCGGCDRDDVVPVIEKQDGETGLEVCPRCGFVFTDLAGGHVVCLVCIKDYERYTVDGETGCPRCSPKRRKI